VRASRLSSCHSSEEKIVLRACSIRDSIGAVSGVGDAREDTPVSVSFDEIRTRRL